MVWLFMVMCRNKNLHSLPPLLKAACAKTFPSCGRFTANAGAHYVKWVGPVIVWSIPLLRCSPRGNWQHQRWMSIWCVSYNIIREHVCMNG